LIKVSTTSTTTDFDGSKEFEKFIREMKSGGGGGYVAVGVLEDAEPYPDGQGVAEVALWNEFGTRNIPERSFLRSAISDGSEKIQAWQKEVLSKVLLGMPARKALEILGFRVMELVRNKIKSGVPPPNAPSTIRAKIASGSLPKSMKGKKAGKHGTSTLVDTGHLLESISYKVYE
jgi:hypothetical protein